MSNPFYVRAFNALAGSLARARQMINEFQLIQSGFDAVNVKTAILLGDLTGALDYSPSTPYITGGYVRYLGSVYRAKQATTGNLPTNATFWQRVDIGAKDLTLLGQTTGIALRSSALIFRIGGAGANSPANIVLTAFLHPALAGPASFSVTSGTATLTGVGNARTLTFANMGSDTVTIRATVVDGSVTYTDDVTLYKVNDGASGLRNRIINGDMGISQRGTAFSNPISGAYTLDRWHIGYNGTGATRLISQAVFPVGSTEADEATRYLAFNQTVAGSGDTFNILQQSIEGVRTFAGKTVTLSFYARFFATANTLPNILLRQFFGSGGSPFFDAILTSNLVVGTGFVRYSFTVTLPGISGKTVGAGDYLGLIVFMPLNAVFQFDISSVQLELGTIATPFEFRPPAVELALCQRYYYQIGGTAGTEDFAVGVFTSAIDYRFIVRHPQRMRATPAINALGTISNFQAISAATYAASGFTLNVSGVDSFDASFAVVGATGGQGGYARSNNVANIIAVNAEL